MKYFFILGNNPALSLAELLTVFPSDANSGQLICKNVFVLEADDEISAKDVIKRLGGTIKIGIIQKELNQPKQDDVLKDAIRLIDIKNVQGKFKFGVSNYGKPEFNTKKLAMSIKQYLREKNIACRWVASREPVLSSVVVEQNKLVNKGVEIVLLSNKNKILIGKTLAVQPFKELSKRDYGRPDRDDYSGMLPPKLAQIMINFAGFTKKSLICQGGSVAFQSAEKGKAGIFKKSAICIDNSVVLLDPFCGSGTVLTETMLMGSRKIIGFDISPKAIQGSKANIKWVQENFQLDDVDCCLRNKSATELSKFIKAGAIDAIVSEPYLGPQRGSYNIKKTIKELEFLYKEAIKEFKKILKPNGRIVLAMPVFGADKNVLVNNSVWHGFKIVDLFGKASQGIFKSLKDLDRLTKRNTIIYGRKGQRVWREIVVLEKMA